MCDSCPVQILVAEGLHPFHDERVRKLMDFHVYLDISDEVKEAWKLQRDMQERGHSEESIKASIAARKPDFDAFIDPQKQYADVIIQVSVDPGVQTRYWDCTGVHYERPSCSRPDIPPPSLPDKSADMRNQKLFSCDMLHFNAQSARDSSLLLRWYLRLNLSMQVAYVLLCHL